MMKTILVLAANPKDTSRLRLDKEVREIGNGLQRAQRRDEFALEQQWAVRPVDVRRAMLDYKPNIVHFCGHGEEDGIAFEDDSGRTRLVQAEALAGLFELFADSVECVLLNACYSEVQARAIVEHIDYVIGMRKGIVDAAAIEFSVAFYDALAAGKSFEFAFRFGCNAIQMLGISEHLTPKLLTQEVRIDSDRGNDVVQEDVEQELDRFDSFYSTSKRTGISVDIYWHRTGLTLEEADLIQRELEREEIPAVVMEHNDPGSPDSVFIGSLVSAQEARIVLSKVPYQIRYIFPLDYPRMEGGDPNGLLIGIGYMSTFDPLYKTKESTPIAVSQADVSSLMERGISNTEFQRRLRNLVSFGGRS